jgi:biopolymer transport protein ExbD
MKLPFEEPEGKGLRLTPLIDVVFLLLIFFLVATRFTQEEMDLSIRLAEVFKARPIAAGPQEIVVNITKEGKYVILGETLGEDALLNTLRSVASKNPGQMSVQIRADKESQFQYPVTVIGLCKHEDVNMTYSCTVLQESP